MTEIPRFEFTAPQFQDFTTPSIFDDGADNFFSEVAAYEKRQDVKASETAELHVEPEQLKIMQADTRTIIGATDDKCYDPNIEDVDKEIKKENIYPECLGEKGSEDSKDENHVSSSSFSVATYGQTNDEDEKDGKRFKGISSTKRQHVTKVQPFSFEERYKRLLKNKEMKIKQILEEEKKMREFHANPLPKRLLQPRNNENDTKVIQCTNPIPPKFLTEERLKQRQKKVSEEDKYQFKARPADVLKKPPFEPKKSEIPIVDPSDKVLNTEIRAKEREVFNQTIAMREAEMDMLRQQRKREEEMEEELEIKKMRKAAVLKANPMPEYKPPKPLLRTTLPTVAKSPSFMSRARQNK